ncbi:MAG: hypothetical protein HKN03_06505 [Acidimicrobiales bacterium]|nr:hypothetical protein [Acidimicrobiales bacterium]
MSAAFTALQVLIAIGFLLLLAVQEVSRAVGSTASIRIWYRAEPHVYRFGMLFCAIILWRFIQLVN